MEFLWKNLCQGAAYRYETQVENGYIPLAGGHRAGICGTYVCDEKGGIRIRDLSSVNIRICRSVRCGAEKLLPKLLCDGKFCSTLIVSEPCGGKTTLLADLVCELSKTGYRAAVIDERGEIGAVFEGNPQKDLGLLADVLDGYPKPYGMMVALRTLAPQVLVCDEIGSYEETEKMLEAMNAGVPVLATAHARDEEELFNRPQIKRLKDAGAISKVVLLKGARSPGKIRKVLTVNTYDGEDFWSSADC
jgi:stage III sporulation protein AA